MILLPVKQRNSESLNKAQNTKWAYLNYNHKKHQILAACHVVDQWVSGGGIIAAH
jgi:hypothetical protein